MVSPGVAVSEPLIQAAIARGVPVIGDIELFAREAKAPVAAITGSNGKSTVTTLLAEMAEIDGCRVAVGGNLGEPALDLLDPAVELYVLELSSFQLETTHTLAPAAAVVLNLSADHLDRYAGIDAYAEAKARIYHHAVGRVFNLDDSRVMVMQGAEGGGLLFTLGVPEVGCFGVDYREGGAWLCCGEQGLLPVSELKIPGRHNVANALAALAMGSLLKLSMEAMLAALQRFPGLPHRTRFVAESGNIRWYNDSKGTNVGACIAALEGMRSDQGADRTVLIAGGEGKGADFSPLAAVVAATARVVILIGRDAPQIAQALEGTVPLLHAESMEDAVALAARQAQSGDRVLLSPACASFDMFRDYRQRGDRFTDAVRRLLQ